jgi:hypothetical protein
MKEVGISKSINAVADIAQRIQPPFMVAEEHQAERFSILQQNVRSQQFSFVVDMRDNSIYNIVGIHNWLGYAQFDMRKYIEITDYDNYPMLRAFSEVLKESGLFDLENTNSWRSRTCVMPKDILWQHNASHRYGNTMIKIK